MTTHEPTVNHGIRFIAEIQGHLAQVRHRDEPGHWTFACCRVGLAALLGIRLRAGDRVAFTLTATDVERLT